MSTRVSANETSQKRPRIINIKGCKSSLVNKQLLVSTGVPSLDFYLGGGIPVGSILLIEEDTVATYSSLLLKYFLAEGIVCNHSIFLASLDQQPSAILNNLPKLCKGRRGMEEAKKGHQEGGMKIAWRYEEMANQTTDSATEQNDHYFDLKSKLDTSLFDHSHVCIAGERQLRSPDTPPTTLLLPLLKEQLQRGEFSTNASKNPGNILRIALNSFGSPLWNTSSSSLCQVLLTLKHMVRSSFSVLLLTLPSHLFHNVGMVWSMENMCDAVVALSAFENTPLQHHPIFSTYHGLMKVKKTPRLNCLVCNFDNDLCDLAFKLYRRHFTIEKFCLPPMFSEGKEHNKATSCGVDF